MMMSKYRVEVKEEPEFIGETFEQRFARITASDLTIFNTYAVTLSSRLPRPDFSFSPTRVPLVFKKR